MADPKLGSMLCRRHGGQLGGSLASKVVVEVLPHLVRKEFAKIVDLSKPAASHQLIAVLSYLSNHLRDGSKDEPGLSGWDLQ